MNKLSDENALWAALRDEDEGEQASFAAYLMNLHARLLDLEARGEETHMVVCPVCYQAELERGAAVTRTEVTGEPAGKNPAAPHTTAGEREEAALAEFGVGGTRENKNTNSAQVADLDRLERLTMDISSGRKLPADDATHFRIAIDEIERLRESRATPAASGETDLEALRTLYDNESIENHEAHEINNAINEITHSRKELTRLRGENAILIADGLMAPIIPPTLTAVVDAARAYRNQGGAETYNAMVSALAAYDAERGGVR